MLVTLTSFVVFIILLYLRIGYLKTIVFSKSLLPIAVN